MGLKEEEKNFLFKVIRKVLNKSNSFIEILDQLYEKIEAHYTFNQLTWTIIVGLEYNTTYGGKIRFCIKYNNGLKVIIV